MDRPLIVDGGLATALESRGYVLHPRLWSAGVFLERPSAVERIHREYLEAGAEILVTASYQMSFEGLAREGLSRDAAADAMRRTVGVARAAAAGSSRRPLVAASVGPYGATLADGSEYRGNYGLSERALVEFHRERLGVLGASGADLLAIETIPSLPEARALHALLQDRDGLQGWISFSCRDDAHLRDGTPLGRAAELFDDCPRITAIGVNCTSPELVAPLIDAARASTRKRIVVYPNSGESWDAERGCWSGGAAGDRFMAWADDWVRRGVWAIGGCCRVGPETIRALATRWGS